VEIPEGFRPKKDLEKETQRLLEGKPKKKKEEKLEDRILYQIIRYKDLTIYEFSTCNYPKKKLKKLKITFDYKNRFFEASYEPSNKKDSQVCLKMKTKHPKRKFFDKIVLKSVLEKYKFYYKPMQPSTNKIYLNGLRIDDEYHYVINIPNLLFCNLELLRDIKGFHQKNFKNVLLHPSYKDITIEEYEYSNLPLYKIKSKNKVTL